MKLIQVATTYGQPCGVGNFAKGLEAALLKEGFLVKTLTSLDDCFRVSYDMVLLQYERGLFPDDKVIHHFCRKCHKPVVLFAHSDSIGIFEAEVDGFMTMNKNILRASSKPCFTFPHPAWTPGMLDDRSKLKQRYGLTKKQVVVGTNGFISYRRQLPQLLENILPVFNKNAWFVDLITSRWLKPEKHIEEKLEELRTVYPTCFRYGTKFLTTRELNLRLQACDLLWCYASPTFGHYASGTVSDQYASGTRMVVTDEEQHKHVLPLPNVVKASARIDAFVETLIQEVRCAFFPRHDPFPVSWQRWAQPIINFLLTITKCKF